MSSQLRVLAFVEMIVAGVFPTMALLFFGWPFLIGGVFDLIWHSDPFDWKAFAYMGSIVLCGTYGVVSLFVTGINLFRDRKIKWRGFWSVGLVVGSLVVIVMNIMSFHNWETLADTFPLFFMDALKIAVAAHFLYLLQRKIDLCS